MFGWVGKILRVDLSKMKIYEIPTRNFVPKFLGGWGIMAKIAWDELDPEIGALDPDNRLMLMTGPSTEDYVRSGFGGHWGPELKFAGYDGIIVQGKAEKPVWIWINDNSIEIKDAGDLWGLTTHQTQESIWSTLGSRRVQISCIGPAGENLVRFASISHGNGSSAAIGGMGCVMGSKNLKAIAMIRRPALHLGLIR
jgi:aldehyde:ferredoxin oxidoreductase